MHNLTRLVVKHAPRAACLFVLIINCSISIHAQQTTTEAKTATVSGRITINDGTDSKPARGVAIALLRQDSSANRQTPAAKTTTDADGRYKLTNINAGKYRLAPLAPAFVAESEGRNWWNIGKELIVAASENIEDINFTMTRGGVITGRVTDGNDKSVIGQRVTIYKFDESDPKKSQIVSQWEFETDDRGIYRVYGLAAGKYLVSVGDAQDDGSITIGRGNTFFARTFHPNARDFARAKAIAITAGGEANDIDIALPTPTKTYTASGRVIDADTNKAIANANIFQGAVLADGKFGSYGSDGAQSDESGEFRIKGLVPGRHGLFASIGEPFSAEQSDFYGDAAIFEITDDDVSSIEIKLHRGATISGTIALEGNASSAALAKLKELRLHTPSDSQSASPNYNNTKISADGSFRLTGVRAGRVRISFNNWQVKGLQIARIERDGIEQRDGIEVAPQENVTGVRVVFTYGAGTIRGQVNLINGTVPTGGRIWIIAKHNSDGQFTEGVNADARGVFSIQNVSAGEYELRATAYAPDGKRLVEITHAVQIITVSDGIETNVNITLDLSKTPKPESKP